MASKLAYAKVNFKEIVRQTIEKAPTGVMAMVIKDTTSSGIQTYEFNDITDINTSDFETTNYDLLRTVMGKGMPKLIVFAHDASLDKTALEKAMNLKFWSYLCSFSTDYAQTDVVNYIKSRWTTKDDGCQGVVANQDTADHEAIINLSITDISYKDDAGVLQANKSASDIIHLFTAENCICPLGESLTGKKPSFEVISVSVPDDVDTAVSEGKIFIRPTYDASGNTILVYSNHVNSLTTTSSDKGEKFQDAKTIRTMVIISRSIKGNWVTMMEGRRASVQMKEEYVSAVNNFLSDLTTTVLYDGGVNRVDFDLDAIRKYLGDKSVGLNDVQLRRADTYNNLYLSGQVSPVGSFTYLDINFTI